MLTFAPGETARTYDVTVRGDAADEPDETVQMDLSSAVNADFGGGARTTLGTIRDDDPAPDATLSLSPSSVSENGGVATVSATLSHPSSAATTVTVTGAPGFYTVGADATIVIAAGATTNATDTATVIAVDNPTDEPNRTATVTATLANGQGAGTVSGATLTLSDDETPPQPTIGAQGAISENGGKTTVTVSLTHPSSAATTVTVGLVDSGLLAAPADAAIVIAAGATTSADTIVFTAVDNDVDAASEVTTRIVLSAVNAQGVATSNPAIWIVLDDDDTAGIAVDPATSTSSRLRTTESGGTSTFTVKLDSEPTGNVALDVASADTTEGTAAPSTLTFTPADWSDAQTVTLTGVADSLAGDDANYTVTLTVDQTDTADAKYDALSAVTVYAVNVDNLHGLDVGAVSGQATEAGGTSTFTVALLTQPSAAVTVAVTSRDPGEGSVSPSALTFAPSAWNTALTVTVTGAQDPVDDGTAAWNVRLDPASGDANYGGLADEDVAVTTTDDDDPPTVTMALDPASVSESGGVATVTARLSHPSGAATTVTVAASAGADTEAGDFTLSSPAALTIAAGATTSSGTVTANGDTVDEPDGSVAVTAAIDNARAAADGTTMAVTDATLAIADDDDPPALSISSPRVSEGAAGATLSFAVGLDAASGKQVTVRYADAGDGTATSNEDYTALAAGTLTFAAGETTQTVEVTVRGDTADEPDETVRVTLSDPVNATVAEGAQTAAGTIEDDDDAPSATLALSPASIGEDGGVATVTATLSHPSSAESTIAVSAAPVPSTGAEAGDFTLSSPAALTVAAGETASAGTVTITAVDDPADAPDKRVTVSGRLSNGQGAGTVAAATLVLADDDPLPVASLALTPASISEDGGVATVTASLSRPSSAAVTITVSASPGAGTDFTLSAAATLTVAAGETASAGVVTITARDVAGHGPDRQVAVAGAATGGRGVADPSDAALAIVDDDAPAVTLSLSSSTIAENGGVATVTATLDQASSVATTVTVAAAAGAGAVSGDFSQDGATLTIAATATTTTDVVTITALNDATDSPDKRVDVSGTAANRLGAASPGGLTLTIEDDDDAPAVVLSLAPSSVEEAAGGAVTVTAQLSHPSSSASTVTVTAGDSGLYTVGADATIVIPAGATASVSDTAVIVVANADDAVHQGSAGRTVAVTATLANGQGAGAVTGAALTLTDDEAIPFPTVTYSPSGAIAENGGKTTVTVTLSHPSGAATTVTATVETGRLSTPADAKIVIAAGATTSADTITIAAVDNDVDAADYDAAFTLNIRNPLGLRSDALQDSGSTLVRKGRAVTLTDDDTAGVSVSPSTSTTSRLRTTESGGTATFTVRLDSEPTGDVELDVASSDTDEGTAAPAVLTFTSSTWSTAQTVTLTGVDDSPPAADGSQGYTVTLTVDTANTADSSYDALSAVTVYAVNSDNEFGLDVGSVTGQATEAGGTATFTVALRTQPSAAVTVSVASLDAGEGSVSPPSLTFTTQNWSTAQTVTATGVQDTIDDGTVTWQVRLDSSSGDANYDGLDNVDVDVTTTDDDGAPGVTLALAPASIAESGTGNVSTVTAQLSHASGAATTVTVTAVSGLYAVGTDAAIVVPAGSTQAASDTATVVAVDNTRDEPDRTGTVTATIANARAAADSTTMAVTGAALTVRDDDSAPTATLALNPTSVSESGGIATVSATLSHPSSEPSTVTVAAVSGAYTVGTDATIVIAAGATTAAADTVLVTAVDDAIHQGSAGRSVTVTAALANGQGAGAVTGAALTLTDDETLPTVALVLSSSSITETGGIATVTATLSDPSSAAVTVTVAAAAGTGAVVDDFTLSTAKTLTFAAGATTSAGLVTVTANGNAVDSPNKSVTVSGTAAGGNGVANPPNVTLTLTDDDALPTVALALSSTSISETGGVSTVTATLSGPSSAAVTVTVAAAAGAGAVAADFTLSTAATLTFAAGATTSAGVVTVTANGNTVDSPNKSVTVSGTAAGGNSVANPPNVTLTLEDDETLPTVALALSASSISETGGVSTVTATLSGPSSAAVTVTVAAAAGAGAVAADFTLSATTTLTFAANATTSTGLVTVTANGNDVDSPNKPVTVSGAAAGGNGVSNPPNVTLTLTDDETLPTVALALSDTSISETGGISTVTATLSGPSSAAVTVTVAAAAGAGAIVDDFTLSTATTLTIAAGATTSAGTVTVTANGNTVDSPNKSVTVSGTSAGGNGVADPPNATLTLTDDETLPTVALVLTPTSISETNGVATVTARLSGASSAAVTVTVAAAAGTGAVAADFTLSGATTLTIAAGSTESAGLVTVTANGNDVDAPNKLVTISGTAAGGNGVANPPNATLTLADDDALPTLALVLTPATVGENGGVSTVTATLSGKSSAAVTLTVSAAPVASTGAVSGDFALSSTTTLTIATGATVSTGTVTVTANDNAADEPDIQVRVSATAAGGNGAAVPSAVTLTIRDDEGPPTVTLALTPSTIDESGTGSTASVTATLNRASSAATTITVSVAPVASTGAAAGDYTLSSAATLTIAAGATTSSGTVTVAAVDNATDAPNRQATVSGTAVNDQGVQQPIARTLTITDDDTAPDATLALSSSSVSENGGMTTVTATLNRRSAQATTVTVQGVSGAYSVGSGSASRIVVAAGATSSPDGVALTAVDNAVDAADRQVTVTAVLANGHGVGTVSGGGIALTLTDDDTAGLAVSPATSTTNRLRTTESGGTATFTVRLDSEPTGDVELDVASSDTDEGTAAPAVLTFTSSTWSTAQTVTLTGVDDSPPAADGSQGYTVTLTVDTANTADSNYDALSAVTVYAVNSDNEFGLDVGSVTGQATEAGGTATFTVALRTQPAAAVTVAVSSRDTSEGTVSPPSLTFTTGGWNTAQTVTATGVQDTIDDGTVTWAVRLDPASGDGDYNTSSVEEDVSVTTTDDDGPPGVTLALAPASIAESGTGNVSTVTAQLSHASGAATTVTVTAVSGLYAVGTDAAIVIPAGSTQAASDTATVVAVDNTRDEPDRTGTVTATIANARAAADGTTMSVTGASLTVRDDDLAPGVTLALDPASVSENGGVSTVTATLSHPSSQPSTVTVTAASGSYTVGTDATITIAAGSTTAASDTVLVTAVDDSIHQGTAGRSATVTGALTNGHGAGAVTGAALALTDDETLPVAALVLGPASISENGGVSTVTATLTGPSSAAVTVTVSTASSSDYTQTGTTLTIAAGATTSAGLVTVRGTDNAVASGSRQVTVSATAAGGNGVANPANAALTVTDDDTPQTTLALSSNSISENGGIATVTATLDRQSAVAVTVAAAAVSPAVAGDFTLSTAATLTFAANATTSTGLVTVTAVNNATDAPDKSVTVSGTASDSLGLTNRPPDVTLAITDDDAAPTATLSLNPASIAESGAGNVATVSATLSHPSSQPSTVTVAAVSGSYTVGLDATITIAAGATTAASDTVLVTAVDDLIHQGSAGRSTTVTASLANGQGAGAVTGAALTLTDDEAAPGATMALNPASVSENGGVSTVTATLSHPSAAPTTLTVSASPVSPAVAGDFTLSSANTLTVAAGSTTSSGTVTVTANDNRVDAADKSVTVTASLANGRGTGAVTAATLTLTDDDTAGLAVSPATSTGSRLETTESAGTATFTVKLATEPTGDVEIGVASSDTSEGTVGPSTLTFTASDWSTAQTVTLTGVDDTAADGNRDYTVTLTIDQTNTADSNYDALSAVTVYAKNRDDEFGLNVSAVTGQATEAGGGGMATFTVALRTQPSAAVTVSVASQDAGEGTASPPSLTFATTSWNTAQTVTVTGANDTVDDGTVTWQVRLDPSSGDADYDTSSVEEDVSVTTTDDDGPPGVTLALAPASIAESGTGNVATVTARLSHASGAATTVTVTAVSGFYAAGTDAAIVIPAEATTAASDRATIVAVDNATDAPDRTETVTASITNARATADSTTMAVTGASLTVRDDDAAPTAALSLNPASVSEMGGLSTVTATLSRPSSEPSTVTVAAVSGSYTVGMDATITIAAGATTAASDTVLVTAVDDDVHQGSAGRRATVAATLANGQGAGAVTGATLTLTDDETLPVASLVLGPASISEEGGVSTVTARLSGPSSRPTTVTVAAAAGTGAVSGDFSLSTAATLTIAAGATTSSGTVTIRANGNAVASGSKQVTVSGTSAGGNGVTNPSNATLTITDDDTPQTTLALSSNSISENGGIATVTATLDRQSTVAVTVTVAAAAGANTAAGDFTLSAATTLTFAANATTSTGLVTVTANDNSTDAPNKSVTVSGTASDSLGLTNDPPSVTLALPDDEAAPGVTLSLNPASVSENGGTSAVSATLSHPSSQPSTVTVTAVAGAYTVGSDATITIAAGSTTAASDTAAIAGVNDDVHQGTAGRSVTVTASLTNGQGAGAVTGAALTLTDDETLPVASLALGPDSISENGGVSTVTAALSGPSSQATTLTVSSSAVASTGAVAGDFTQSGTMLTIAAGATTSTGTVTVRGNDNDVDADNKSVTVTATATGGNGVAAPSAATLTLADDEATATATLVLTPSAILENGEVSTVTARLSHPTTEATTLTVSAAPGTGAVASDFSLSSTTALTIAAGGTTSTGLVTVTAVDNLVASGRKRVTVSATAASGRMVMNPSSATLIIRDDEFGLDESAVSGPVTEDGGQATLTVALQTQPSAAVTVSVSSLDPSEGRVAPSTLVFTVQNWETAQTVTVTGADDDVDDGNVDWKVRLDTSSGGDVNYNGLEDVDVDVRTIDNDNAPTVELALEPSSISEDGEVSTVTATLSRPSVAATTVTVTAAPVSPAVADDFTQTGTTLIVAAGGTKSTETVTVTITAEDNAVDALDKTVTVSGTATNDGPASDGMGVGAVESATLTITDDDEKGFKFAPEEALVAAGGSGSYMAVLTSRPTGTVTVTISWDNDDLKVSPSLLTFAPSEWNGPQTVTVTGTAGVAASALRHVGSGGDYGEVEKDLWVAGSEAADIRTTGNRGDETTRIIVMNGQPVTVTKAVGVPPGVRVVPAEAPTGPLAVKYTALNDEQAAAAVGSGYSLGPAESRVAVDVPSVLGGGLLCLPVTDGLRNRAAGRELILFHDGSAVQRSRQERGPDGQVIEVCATVPSFSPFAVGYKDSKPVFPDFTMTVMVFTVDEAIDVEPLPRADGGDSTSYELGPLPLVLPLGLDFDDGMGEDECPGQPAYTLCGTPTEEFAEKGYTWTATDLDGEKDERSFTIEVIPALGLARARLKAINESILPELSRAQWGSVVEAVTGRLEAPGTGGGVVASVAEALKAQEGTQDDLSWREALAGRTFALGLDDSEGGGGVGGAGGSGGRGHGVVVWGSGERRTLALEKEALSWSGEAYSILVGADGRVTRTLRAGVAASWFESRIDYTDKSGVAAIGGTHESRMRAIHPYLGWSGDDGSRLWGVLGYGEGEIEIVDAEIVERFGVQRSDSRLLAVGTGGSVRAVSEGALTIDVKGAVEGTQYSVEANGERGAIEKVSVKTQRLRLSVEGSRRYALEGGGSLVPALEVGVRWDGGDGETGAGVELGGGVSWRSASGAVSAEARGRGLVAHESGLNEWGAGGAVRLDAGGDGRGLSLSVLPSWGSVESGLARLWEEGVTGRAPGTGAAGARLDAELGYGFGAFGGAGVATPYLGFGYENGGDRRYRVGTRLGLGDTLDLTLEAERKEAKTLNHGARIDLNMRW